MYCILCGGRQGFKRFELFFGGLESPAFGRVTFELNIACPEILNTKARSLGKVVNRDGFAFLCIRSLNMNSPQEAPHLAHYE